MDKNNEIEIFTSTMESGTKTGLQVTVGELFKDVAKFYGPLEAAHEGHVKFLKLAQPDPG